MYLPGDEPAQPTLDADLLEELVNEVSATEFTINHTLTTLHVRVS